MALQYTPQPILLQAGPINFYTWGLMFAIAILIAGYFALKEVRRKKLSEDHFYNGLIWSIILGLIGARIFHVALYWQQYSGNFLDVFAVWNGGIVSYGGYIFGILGLFFYCRIKKINFWQYIDCFAPGIALGEAIARIGCFLNWDDYGIASSLPWAVQVAGDVPRHPTQIYYMLASFAIFLILWWMRDKKEIFGRKVFDGAILAWYILLYSFARFFIDFARHYENARYASQILLAIAFVTALLLLLYYSRKQPKDIKRKQPHTR